MRRVLLIILLAILPAVASAQSAAERDAVLKTVQVFFDTMTARDVIGAGKIMVPGRRPCMYSGAFTMEAKCEPSPLGPLQPGATHDVHLFNPCTETMSLVTVERVIARRLPSRDQAKTPIGRLSVNRVS
jgi:hypothetical protein